MHTDDMLNKEDIGALVLTMVISYLRQHGAIYLAAT